MSLLQWTNQLYKRRFEALLLGSLLVLVVCMLYNKWTGTPGTWSLEVPETRNTLPFVEEPPPQSYASKGERKVKQYLEKIFQRPFRKHRPLFLSNSVTGGNHNLELDCYNEDLQLAVEFNGRQHYDYVPFFHKNKEAFLNQKYRDEMKRQRCYDRGVVLIEVPYTEEKRIGAFLMERLRKYQHLRDEMVNVSINID